MNADPDIVVRGPLTGQGAQAEAVMRALPAWFGIEAAIVGYARAADTFPTLVADVNGAVVGFATLRATSEAAVELHAMAVLPAWHRRGAGRALVERAAAFAAGSGADLLHVKTLAPTHPDPGYAATRSFYAALGFIPLEILPELWGPDNPCLLLVRPLRLSPRSRPPAA